MRPQLIERTTTHVHVSTVALLDANLSLKAKGLLVVLLMWPVEQRVTMTAIADICRDGKEAIRSAWDELSARGYIDERDGRLRIAENPQLGPQDLRETRKCDPRRLPASTGRSSRGTFAAAPPTLPENPPVATVTFAGNPPKSPDGLSRETRQSRPAFGGKPAKVQAAVVVEVDVDNISQEGISNDDGLGDGDLLDGLTTEERERMTTMANSWVGRFERMAPILAKEAAMGIDVRFYFEAILSWSKRQPPRGRKNQRTVEGWVETVRQSMAKDKERGQLRMIGRTGNVETDTLAMVLSIGRQHRTEE